MISASMLKVGASLAALFVFGGVCGFTIATRRMTNPVVRAQLEERWIEARRRDDAARLKLTAEQAEQVRPTYQQMLADIRAVRETAAVGVIDAAKKQGRVMWSQLTPEQQQEFLRLSEERRAQMQKRSSS
jgi:hypothetical protein